MKPFFCALLLFLIAPFAIQAQYATLGTGVLRQHVWWFDWNGVTIANGLTKTFTTADGTLVTIRFSNVSNSVQPDVMNTWSGAVLHYLYDFSDPNIKPALHSRASSQTIQFRMNITATRGGTPVPFTLIGVDAEASTSGETTTFTTDGPVWNTLEIFRNSTQTINPVAGCGTSNIKLTETYAGGTTTAIPVGQNPLMGARTTTGAIQLDVTMERLSGRTGGMAVAFGLYAPYDRGDLISGYGTAQHELSYTLTNGCAYPVLPVLQQNSNIYIGSVPGDADGTTALDDNDDGADEEGVPVFADYNGSTGIYTLNVNVTNTTGADAYLSGWFDFNRDGQFTASEFVTATVPPGTPSITFTWSGLPYDLPGGLQPNFAFRFRMSSDRNSVQSPSGLSPDGEVEDYLVPLVQVCQITKVNAGADVTLCAGETSQLQATGALTYTWNAAPELSNLNIADPVATPVVTKEFILSALHTNGCNSKDSVVVTVIPRPVFTAPSNTDICIGTQITFSASGGDHYEWMDVNNNLLGSGPNYVITPAASTVVRVAMELTQCNLRETFDIPVTVYPLPTTSVSKSNDINCQTGRATLTASGGVTYLWDDGPGISDPARPVQQATTDRSRMYYVMVTDQHNCSSLDSVEVLVSTESGLAKYNMPNAFSPNGDGKNDCFGIKLPGLISKFDFTIFDRWGKIMFHTNNINDCWDGTFNGVPLDISTFVYIITIDSVCGHVERKGTVTLVR